MDPMIRARLTRWLLAPSLTGRLALLFGIFILVVPTIVRADVDDVGTGSEFTPSVAFAVPAPPCRLAGGTPPRSPWAPAPSPAPCSTVRQINCSLPHDSCPVRGYS